MKRFRYEAIDSSGTPIFGTLQCEDVEALTGVLEGRGQQVRSFTELSLEEFNRQQSQMLPRLFQMRVGERIHDALLTGLPAHAAVRAVACEPIQGPLLFAVPWAYALSFISLMCVLGALTFGYISNSTAGALAVVAITAVPLAHFAIRKFLYERPRRILLEVADRLEQGFDFDSLTVGFLPVEMRALLTSDLQDETKVRATSEIMPWLLVRSNHLQRLAFAIAIPLAVFLLLNLVLCAAAMLIIPVFAQIYDDFGIETPALTQLVLKIGTAAASIGWPGLTAMSATSIVIVIMTVLIIAGGWGHDWLSRIPWFGTMFRWSMQARVCRMIATMCRNGADPISTVKTATMISGFRSVRIQGEQLAASIHRGDRNWSTGRALAGLPISMLKNTEGSDSAEQRRIGISATFEHLGGMLEQAAMTQSAVLAAIVRFTVFAYAILVVVTAQLSLLLPMIKLTRMFL